MDEEQAREEGAEKEVERLMHETKIWRVANSAQWVAWGIVQAKVEGMDEALEELRERRTRGERAVEMGKRVMNKITGHGAKENSGGKDKESANSTLATEDGSVDSSAPERKEEEESASEKPHVPHEHEIDDDAEFDYLAYAQDRALFFWGDVLELGLVQEDELPPDVVSRAKRIGY